MFELSLQDPVELRGSDDAALVAAIEECARAEAAAGARRLAAIAELTRRRTGSDEHADWACDEWDCAAAEVAAALGLSHHAASAQMRLSLALDRLPAVAALHLSGRLSSRLMSVIAWRTHLVRDPEALRLIDTALARHARDWGPFSVTKLEQAIDWWIDRHDPGALRQIRASARSRDVCIGDPDDDTATASLWGRLYSTDAALLDRRLQQMAHSVCDDDPRTIAQRRADALGALAAGADRLACACGSADCPSGAGTDERAGGVVLHLLGQASVLEPRPDPHMSGEAPPGRPITPGMTVAEMLAGDPEPEPEPDPAATPAPAALITGGGVVPGPLVAELIRGGAKISEVRHPGDLPPEPHYRPSAKLAEFIRIRDMTCRFPGCDVPAEFCDIDHTVPYPTGPTHASNLKCECRKHHLLKTFWPAWHDEQLPDGTVIWTAPNGRTYTTRPGSRIFFPAFNTTTARLPETPTPTTTDGDRGVMMPRRRRTREQDRAYRIDAERALNADRVASQRADTDTRAAPRGDPDDPPPF